MLCESRAENMEQKLENLGELIDIAGGFHSAREFLDHAALATNREREGDEDVVSLMTLHKAKGLPHVFLPAFEAGIIPSSYGEVEEERRLAYVALTRGMRQVRISWALYRRGPTEPSPFVDAIPERSRVFLSRLNPKNLSPQRERAYVTSLAACVATAELGQGRRCERCSILLPSMNLHRRQRRRRRPSVPMANAHALSAAPQRGSASGSAFSTIAPAVGRASPIETRFKP
jgi:hypothetical protein